MKEINVYAAIAWESGELFSRWGPCVCGGMDKENLCLSCINANEIESKGLDWDEEYSKAIKAQDH